MSDFCSTLAAGDKLKGKYESLNLTSTALAGCQWNDTGMVWVTANRYEVALSDHLYGVMKHSCPDGSGIFQNGCASSVRVWGCWMVWWVKKKLVWIIYYCLCGHQVSSLVDHLWMILDWRVIEDNHQSDVPALQLSSRDLENQWSFCTFTNQNINLENFFFYTFLNLITADM